jgi:hypothetical protein
VQFAKTIPEENENFAFGDSSSDSMDWLLSVLLALLISWFIYNPLIYGFMSLYNIYYEIGKYVSKKQKCFFSIVFFF